LFLPGEFVKTACVNRPPPLRFYICYLFAILCVSFVSTSVSLGAERQTEVLKWPEGLPVYDHIVIVMEENKDYSEVIGNPAPPYINEVLKKEGASFTRMFGEEHYSQGNYFWLFSGDNQTVGFDDEIPNAENNPNCPFTTPNLGSQLISKGLSFKGYAESLPVIGFTDDSQGLYARKHLPWISFPTCRTARLSKRPRTSGSQTSRRISTNCRPFASSSRIWTMTCTTARTKRAFLQAIAG